MCFVENWMPRKLIIAVLALLVLVAAGAALYRFALPGLSSARPNAARHRNGSRDLAAPK